MSDITGEVERVQGPSRLIEAQADQFAKILPTHIGPEKFTRWALSCLRDPNIAACMATDEGRLSVMKALMDCASLGLEPGRTYHLVPFKGIVTGVTDYKGEIELICRANKGASVIASLVHQQDAFAMHGANVPPLHEADWFGDRGDIIGGYAYVQLAPAQYSLVIRMSEREFLRHRAEAKTTIVWDKWPEAMRLKTMIHQLRKWVPWSAEWL